MSRGNRDVWPDFDWGGSDDMALIWFDPEATGEDETGNEGVGMYRYANGGERYDRPAADQHRGGRPVRRRELGHRVRRGARGGHDAGLRAAGPRLTVRSKAWPAAWMTKPARPPTTVPLMRMNCRSGPSSSSSRSAVSWRPNGPLCAHHGADLVAELLGHVAHRGLDAVAHPVGEGGVVAQPLAQADDRVASRRRSSRVGVGRL